MKKIALPIIFFLLAGWLQAEGDTKNCFTIVAGRQATADGSVLLAHNEDDRGRLLVNVHKVPAQEHHRSDTIAVNTIATLPQLKNTPGHTVAGNSRNRFRRRLRQ